MSAGEEHDPHFKVVDEQAPPRRPTRDTGVALAAVVAGSGAVGFAVGLRAGAPTAVHGLALAVGLAGLAVAVRRYFALTYPRVEAVEERETASATDGGPVAEVEPVARRSLVRRALVGAGALLGLSLAAPVSSLGPRPGDRLRQTAWQTGRRLVTSDGQPLRAEEVLTGAAATVWPEGHVGEERAAVIVLRLSGRSAEEPTNLGWVVDDTVVAYSKICTHAACPVGLFRERDNVLFCPCHQTTFDAVRAAAPTFGPAARALPQLPLTVDDDGFLAAQGDFAHPVGPPFGHLPR